MTLKEKEILENLNRVISSLLLGKVEKDFCKEIPYYSWDNVSGELRKLCETTLELLKKFDEGYEFIVSLSDGELDNDPPSGNYLISPYKQLQSNLRHLTWQAKEIADGDYNQKVSFLGDFSVAFNSMIESLKERERLRDELAGNERELRELNSFKDRMFSIIAHDLRGPLGNTKALLDFLVEQKDFADEIAVAEYMKVLQSSAGSTFNLLENLLNWARSQRNEIIFNPVMQALNPVICEVLDLVSANAASKNIKLRFDNSVLYNAYFDVDMIRTVIRNLVNNAVKFSNVGGEVCLTAATKDDGLFITIADNGVGIKKDNLELLFAQGLYFTTKGTKQEKGSGLGLTLCKEFVKRNNGTLSAESKEGKGTAFTFSLPLSASI